VGKALSDWVNKELKKKGWSMRELARRSKIDASTVSKVLSGEDKPGAKFYQGVARAFGYPLESIERLDREGIEPFSPGPDNTLDDLAALVATLPQEARQEVLLFAHYLSWRLSQNLPL
jgi:transcriptional regulator with XRE-family HTH domain